MPKEKPKTVRVNVNIPEDLYWEYKKRLMDDRTNTTYQSSNTGSNSYPGYTLPVIPVPTYQGSNYGTSTYDKRGKDGYGGKGGKFSGGGGFGNGFFSGGGGGGGR